MDFKLGKLYFVSDPVTDMLCYIGESPNPSVPGFPILQSQDDLSGAALPAHFWA